MSTNTKPSQNVLVLDIPETRFISSKFVYNFYDKDETAIAIASDPILTQKDGRSQNSALKRLPRYVSLSWQIPTGPTQKIANGFLRNHAKDILSEEFFAGDSYTSITLADTAVLDKLQEQELVASPSSSVSKELAANDASSGYNFVQSITENREDIRALLKNAAIDVQISNKVAASVLRKAALNPSHSLSFELKEPADATGKRVSAARSKDDFQNPNFSFEPIELKKAGSSTTSAAIVGYAIDRYRSVKGSDSLQRLSTIFVDDVNQTSIIDLDVLYGCVQRYVVRVVATITVPAIDSATGEVFDATMLVSSRPSYAEDVQCEEFVPPPSPADFSVVWDYEKNMPLLVWTFPPNLQRDIKHFQCFKRRTEYEPFQLVRQYSFDDPGNFIAEQPDTRLVTKRRDTVFWDEEYRIGETVIYAVASVDAHGMTSGYSEQFLVRFNSLKNRLDIKQASPAGAPKQFPNIFWEDQVSFRDSFTVPAGASMEVITAPDAIKFVNISGKVISGITTSEFGSYNISILDPNSGSSSTCEITIETPPVEPKKPEIANFFPDYGDSISKLS